MTYLAPIPDSFSLEKLAARIRRSSNFRFSWQFFTFSGFDPASPVHIRDAVAAMISDPACHRFLADSFDPIYDSDFRIEPLHPHCDFHPTSDALENTLSAAANDNAGAYSKTLREATNAEKRKIEFQFKQLGDFHQFELLPSGWRNCTKCAQYDGHLFTNWFFGVAWDWCLVATWPTSRTMWIGCLTDTD